MHRGIEGKEVTFKDVLILMLRHFEKILTVALAFAVVFAGLGAVKAAKGLSSTAKQEAQEEYELKKEEYESSVKIQEDNIKQGKKQLKNLEDYTSESIYYNMDAFEEIVGEYVFYVDTGYQIVPEQYYQTPDKTSQIASAYCTAYRSDDLYQKLCEIIGKDVETQYLDELIDISRAGSTKLKDSVGNVTISNYKDTDSVVRIRVKAPNKEVASLMTHCIFEHLNETITETMAPHKTTVLSDSVMTVSDSELEALQQKIRQDMLDLQQKLKEEQTALDELYKTEPKLELMSTGGIAKKAILFAVLGGIFGGVLACLWVLLAYLSDDRLDGAYQLQKLYNLELLANVPSGKKAHKPWFVKLINRMEHNPEERMFSDNAAAADYTDTLLETICCDQGVTVAVASTQDTPAVEAICKELTEKNRKCRYLPALNLLGKADSLEKITEADAVILLEASGVSRIGDINRQIIRLEKTGKEILGIMLVD